jgi:hypothetical protein
MQFAVPQFTDVEDKLIGPLTLKQFLVLLAAGGLCMAFWSLPISKIVSILIDVPIAILGITLAFATYNSRPMLTYIIPFIVYSVSPKVMIFARETNQSSVTTQKVVQKIDVESEAAIEAPDSRLRKLAYLLDQKTQEEKELIDQTIKR